MVIDTGIFIEFLRAKDKSKTILFDISHKHELEISVVTLYELLMGATNEQKENDIYHLTSEINILPLTKEVAITASNIYHQLRVKNQLIEFRDIFVAATAIANKSELLTLNLKHFKRIDQLAIFEMK